MSLELGRNPAKRLFPGGPPWHARAALIDELEHIDEKMSYLLQNDQLSGLKVSVKCQYGVNSCQFLEIRVSESPKICQSKFRKSISQFPAKFSIEEGMGFGIIFGIIIDMKNGIDVCNPHRWIAVALCAFAAACLAAHADCLDELMPRPRIVERMGDRKGSQGDRRGDRKGSDPHGLRPAGSDPVGPSGLTPWLPCLQTS